MCSKIGVDPLASNKGFWAEMLGVGDFYYELGVQIIEVPHLPLFHLPPLLPPSPSPLSFPPLLPPSPSPLSFPPLLPPSPSPPLLLPSPSSLSSPSLSLSCVQLLIQVCYRTRAVNGGFIEISELCTHLQNRRGKAATPIITYVNRERGGGKRGEETRGEEREEERERREERETSCLSFTTETILNVV